jgi:hypothetical protein
MNASAFWRTVVAFPCSFTFEVAVARLVATEAKKKRQNILSRLHRPKVDVWTPVEPRHRENLANA